MKVKDISNQFGLDNEEFVDFLYKTNIKLKDSLSGWKVDDSLDVTSLVLDFKKYEAQKAFEIARKNQAEQDKKTALTNMLITSGFTFDGYTIIKYSGYISGDDAISVDRGFSIFGGAGNVKDKLMESLVLIRRNALAELKEAAYALGCNAVIGVDYDYITLDPQTANLSGGTTYQPYVFGVTANGNAVIIERNEG